MTPSETPRVSEGSSSFSVTSPDFTDGGELADWATASAFGGQCTGDNLNPALTWDGAPNGTATFAITVIDESAKDFVHWVHVNIPADVQAVARGEGDALPGSDGATGAGSTGYFGPCPPGPDHHYVFTVIALDAELDVRPGVSYADFAAAAADHILATATITGLRSGPA